MRLWHRCRARCLPSSPTFRPGDFQPCQSTSSSRMPRFPTGEPASTSLAPAARSRGIEPDIAGEAGRTIDARGRLVSPPFVDCHFHMDATLSLGLPRLNQSGTLLEGIALWGELKPLLTHEAVMERALRYCDLAVSQGLLAIRTHVDVCDDRLLARRGAARREEDASRPISTCSSSPFRRTATTARRPPRTTSTARSTSASISSAAFRISSAPWPMARASVTALCEIAAKRGLLVDMHCDETDDPMSRHIETLALRDAAARPRRPRRRLASHLDALDGQLLRLEAPAADGGGAASRRSPIRSSTSSSRAATTPIPSAAA